MASPKLVNSSACVGCGICALTCENIEMTSDEEGFLSPRIEDSSCARCRECKVICPALYDPLKTKPIQKVFAAQAKDQKLLIETTAGGLFPVLAQYILSQGGVVFGAAYDEDMRVVHRSARTMQEVAAFNGSKYVQSDVTEAVKEAKALLKDKIPVLFSGTPCQIAGLLQFCTEVEKNYLTTIDVICYGNPSPKLFRMYLDQVEKNYGGIITDYRFRDKHTYGWSHTTVIDISMNDGTLKRIEDPDFSHFSYYRMFSRRDCFRKACYSCRFNRIERVSDITTGNFWKIDNISNAFDCALGVSMVLLNTERGVQLFEKVKSEMFFEERTLQEAINGNDALVKTTEWVPWRDQIYKCLNKYGYGRVVRVFYPKTIVGKFIRRIREKTCVLLLSKHKGEVHEK